MRRNLPAGTKVTKALLHKIPERKYAEDMALEYRKPSKLGRPLKGLERRVAFTCSVPGSLADQVRTLAAERGQSLGALVELALRSHLAA